MSSVRHDAIIVSICGDLQHSSIETAHEVATRMCANVSPIVGSTINGYHSFLVAPDGSKEGWPESREGDQGRAEFVHWLDAQQYEDGSSPYDWVEVRFADDGPASIVAESSQ